MSNYMMPIIVVSGVALVGFVVYQYMQGQQAKTEIPGGRVITSGAIRGGLLNNRSFDMLNPVITGSTPAEATRNATDYPLEDTPMAFRRQSLSAASFSTLTERF
jgi:hypothetical protein